MTKLQSEGLEQQLRLRSVVDNRRELSGRALVAPTGKRVKCNRGRIAQGRITIGAPVGGG